MSEPPIERPSPALEALLKHERVPPAQPDTVRARTLARARAAPPDAPAAPGASPTWPGSRLLLAAAAGAVIAGGGAAVLHAMRRPPAPPATAPLAAPATTAPPPAPSAGAPEAALPAPEARRRPPALSRHDGLVDEVQLLGRARQDDTRGDYPGVLALVAQHERAHPNGRLTEEREVLRVKALIGLHRTAEARAAAARFRRDFPRSVLLSKVSQMTNEPRAPGP